MGKHLEGPLAGPHAKFGLVVSCHNGKKLLTRAIKEPNAYCIVRNHTALDDRTAIEERTGISGEIINPN